MKIFLSWSGEQSYMIARTLKNWLPIVIQSTEAYMSSEDIDKGARWITEIGKELKNSRFGVLCVTKENLEAPWLYFEAGAISNSIGKASVCPFLVDVTRSEIKDPLKQFQLTFFEKEDVRKLLKTINKCNKKKLSDHILNESFENGWPNLLDKIDKIRKKDIKKSNVESMIEKKEINALVLTKLEEIIDLTRPIAKFFNPYGIKTIKECECIYKKDMTYYQLNKINNKKNLKRRQTFHERFHRKMLKKNNKETDS